MRINVFIIIGICLWLMPSGTEAFPVQRNGLRRCPAPCNIYCLCGYQVDEYNCPKCACRPSNSCTGRHPNAYGRPQFVKSHILY